MPNVIPKPGGKAVSVTKAKAAIAAYVREHPIAVPPDGHVYAHLFNFALLKDFVDSISELIRQGETITAVRIYHAKSKRGTLTTEESDLVFVPVLSDDRDYYNVFKEILISPVIIGESTPCPNICNEDGKQLGCP